MSYGFCSVLGIQMELLAAMEYRVSGFLVSTEHFAVPRVVASINHCHFFFGWLVILVFEGVSLKEEAFRDALSSKRWMC